MSEEKKELPPIIIKKKKPDEHAPHGGSWKVAYADFVTAMMAFFLLMWLLNMTKPEEQKAIAEHFNSYNIFDKGGRPHHVTPDAAGRENKGAPISIYEKIPAGPTAREDAARGGVPQLSPADADKLESDLRWSLEAASVDASAHLEISEVPEGIRIDITDAGGRPLFAAGGSSASPTGATLLKTVGAYVATMNRRVAIGGHTDETPVGDARSSNWELSAERAMAARQLLSEGGLALHQIDRVTGHGSRVPLVGTMPGDARNRRISVLVLHEAAQAPAGMGGEAVDSGATPR